MTRRPVTGTDANPGPGETPGGAAPWDSERLFNEAFRMGAAGPEGQRPYPRDPLTEAFEAQRHAADLEHKVEALRRDVAALAGGILPKAGRAIHRWATAESDLRSGVSANPRRSSDQITEALKDMIEATAPFNV